MSKKYVLILVLLVILLSIPMVAMAITQDIPVRAEIPGEFSCTITDEFAQSEAWYPNWVLPPATTTTTLWGNIQGHSNYDWQVSADMNGYFGSLENEADDSIYLEDPLKIVMESWPESDVNVKGWSHSVQDVTGATDFDNDYSLKQAVTVNDQPGTYAGTITFTCVNVIGGTCGDDICSTGEDPSSCPEDCQVICGNGVIEGTEVCDDGNTAAGDGCSATCTVETGYICTAAGCSLLSNCGDNTLNLGEACDDGNTAAGDGCSATCSVEKDYICTPLGCELAIYCNDGIHDPVEECEGSELGCNKCAIKPGYICTFNNHNGDAGCSPSEYCHDGAGWYDEGEECDLDFPADASICSETCTLL
jgi:cysteine-rich repeat protein